MFQSAEESNAVAKTVPSRTNECSVDRVQHILQTPFVYIQILR